jgi:hypothetical protein
MLRRHRIKHTLTFEERLKQLAERLGHEARRIPIGKKRDELLKRARQAETAAGINKTGINKWLTSSIRSHPI